MLLFTIAHIAPFLHPCIGSYLLFYPPIIKRNPIHSDDCRYPQGALQHRVFVGRERAREREAARRGSGVHLLVVAARCAPPLPHARLSLSLLL